MTGWSLRTLADDLNDLAADGFEVDAETFERASGDAFTLVDQPEKDVLGADVVVVEETRLFLGEDDDPPGPVCESLEHVSIHPSNIYGAPLVGAPRAV